MENQPTTQSADSSSGGSRFFFGLLNRSGKEQSAGDQEHATAGEAGTDGENQVGGEGTKEKNGKQVSDLEAFFKARFQVARQRNTRFQERFDALRSGQTRMEDILERIRTNPISLLCMSEIDRGGDMEAVVRLAGLRRQDTFSGESDAINNDIREFEQHISSWFRMAYLALEAALEAPLPELGRPLALKKSIWTCLKSISSCNELKFYLTSAGKTLHQFISDHAITLQNMFMAAQGRLDTLYPDVEQPMKVEPLFNVEEALQNLEVPQTEYSRPPSSDIDRYADVTSHSKQ